MSERWAYSIAGVAHIVKTETPAAGVGVMIEAKCGHKFLAREVRDEKPEHLGYCCEAYLLGWKFRESI